MFTSLSTVGFGDFRPYSSLERLVCATVLLLGVAIFSYIMGKFIEILDVFKSLNDSLDDGDNLGKFIGILRKYNNNKPIDPDFKLKLEIYFDYRWNND